MEKVFVSDISGESFPESERVSAQTMPPSLLDLVIKEHPNFTRANCMSISEINLYRQRYIEQVLKQEMGEIGELEQHVVEALKNDETLSSRFSDESHDIQLTFGERIADKIADFGGSWTFILSFLGFLGVWICINVFWYNNRGFDPYPFILLNLLLSCIAALQAPVIMMSQNRQEDKDRQRARQDYMINLKSELEIRMLHEKMDHLIIHQQQRLVEIQHVQIEMMNDILKTRIETVQTVDG